MGEKKGATGAPGDCGRPALKGVLSFLQFGCWPWYLQWEFEPSPTDPLHLFLLTKDLKAILLG
ncbi:MAG: hypothetical protein RJA09_2031 [Pseudomonadota bacterium]|jgi:hypothetical protein